MNIQYQLHLVCPAVQLQYRTTTLSDPARSVQYLSQPLDGNSGVFSYVVPLSALKLSDSELCVGKSVKHNGTGQGFFSVPP